MACSICHGSEFRPSRPDGLIERWVAAAGLYPFRCLGCWHRVWRRGNSRWKLPTPGATPGAAAEIGQAPSS
jgi:hypothetical protein